MDRGKVKTLLSHRINETLMLRRDAPFPSEIKDARDAVNSWRRTQRLHVVGLDCGVDDRDADGGDSDTYDGGEAA